MSFAGLVGEKKGQAKSSCSDMNFTDCSAKASGGRRLWVAGRAAYVTENSLRWQGYVIEMTKTLFKNWLKGIR